MIYSFNNTEDLIDLSSDDRPLMRRPIIGSNARNESKPHEFGHRFQTLSISRSNSSDADSCGNSCTSTTVSPFGSPLKYSPVVWPQSVHSWAKVEVKANTVSKLLSFDDDSNDWKSEFDRNGKLVPLDGPSRANLEGRPVEAPKVVGQYQLFGTNGFNYARFKTSIGPKPSKEAEFQKMSRKRFAKSQTFCSFCKNNNETPEIYNSHILKDPFGKTICPVLRKYDCPICRSGGGDFAHTIRYCPQNKPDVTGRPPIQSVIKLLKNSRSADGKKRFVSHSML